MPPHTPGYPPIAPREPSKLPWILGGCGCLTLLLILAGAAAYGIYRYRTGTVTRPPAITTPAPARGSSPAAQQDPSTTSDNYGTRIEFNGGEVYHTASVTDAEARKVGAYLVKYKFFDGTPKSVQLNKTGAVYEFRMVVNESVVNDQSRMPTFQTFAKELSVDLFNNSPVVLHLCDNRFQTLRVVTADSAGSSAAATPAKDTSGADQTYTNVKAELPADLQERFVPFRLSYPSTFTLEKRPEGTYIRLYKYANTAGDVAASLEVTWFDPGSPETKAGKNLILNDHSQRWAGFFPQFKYKELKRQPEMVGGAEGTAMLFQFTMPDEAATFVSAGKVMLVRPSNQKHGVCITAYGTWQDPNVKSAGDVGVSDDLGRILRSFKFL